MLQLEKTGLIHLGSLNYNNTSNKNGIQYSYLCFQSTMLHQNVSTVAQNGQSKATIKDSEAKDVQLFATCNILYIHRHYQQSNNTIRL